VQLNHISSKSNGGKTEENGKSSSSRLSGRIVSNFIKFDVVDVLTSGGIGVGNTGTYFGLTLGRHHILLTTKLGNLGILIVSIVVGIVHVAGNAILRNNALRGVRKRNSISRGEDSVIVLLCTVCIFKYGKVDSLSILGALGAYIVLSVLIASINLATLKVFLKVKSEIIPVILLTRKSGWLEVRR